MRVLKVLPGIDPTAGAETSFAVTAAGLLDRGVELHLALLTDRQGLVPKLVEDGVVVHDLSDSGGRIGQFWALRRLVRQIRPDLLHATLWDAAVVTQPVAWTTHCPVVVTWAAVGNAAEHVGNTTWKHRVIHHLDHLLASRSRTYFHAVTRGVADANGPRERVPVSRIFVVERGRPDLADGAFDTDLLRTELGLAEGDRVVLATGREEPIKDHLTLVRAMDKVHSAMPDARLLIAGDRGRATEDVTAEVSRLGLDGVVRLLGHRGDVPALLELAEVT